VPDAVTPYFRPDWSVGLGFIRTDVNGYVVSGWWLLPTIGDREIQSLLAMTMMEVAVVAGGLMGGFPSSLLPPWVCFFSPW
jgi:hypothetical protein